MKDKGLVRERNFGLLCQVKRAKPVSFMFDGNRYFGLEGDTLASALLANGVSVVGRSFKLHRPRGIISAGPEESGGIVQINNNGYSEPNVKATQIELYEGLITKSVNTWPSAQFDLLAFTSLFGKIFSAGFYYKTFMWPRWRYFRPFIRRMAGLGHLPKNRDLHRYENFNAHCDILIIGSGPSGLSAALVAAKGKAKVILVEDQGTLGGSLLWENENIKGLTGKDWLAEKEKQLRNLPNVTILTRSTASGYYDHNIITVNERILNHVAPTIESKKPRERFWNIRAKRVVLATGAIERPLVFPNNDRPGVMLASAVRQYLNRYGVLLAKNIVIFTNNDSAYRTALDISDYCLTVTVVDVRKEAKSELINKAIKSNVSVIFGSIISNVSGRKQVTSIEVCPLDSSGKEVLSEPQIIKCELVAMSGGWTPTVHLFSQSGGKLFYDEHLTVFRPAKSVQMESSVGAANGEFSLEGAIEQGEKVANDYLAQLGFQPIKLSTSNAIPGNEYPIQALWQVPVNLKRIAQAKRFVDFQHDVHANDVALAARENFISVEHFKRYTTNGMACDQGKTSNVNGLALLGLATDRLPGEVGTTKFRPPYTPVTIGSIVGSDRGMAYSPARQLPLHVWHAENNAKLEDYGPWLRPAYYKRKGESEKESITREILNTRSNVSLLDYSPLSKIEIKGTDAATFVNRIYANNVSTVKNGACRYGLVLNEHGTVIDDGVLGRLTDNQFILTTTSGGADNMLRMVNRYRQVEWPELDVAVSSQTTFWATLSLTGPNARQVLEKLITDIDISKSAFPHMSIREGHIEGIRTRLFRVSFTGELGFEINIPVGNALFIWEKLMDVGSEYGIAPLGLEALDVMRTEKGFLHVGMETDSTSVPSDVGWGIPVGKKKADFIGKRSLIRTEQSRPDREVFVGFKSLTNEVLPFGAHIVSQSNITLPTVTEGRVTTSYFSPTIKRPIALGLLRNGNSRQGEVVTFYHQDKYYRAEVVAPTFYDPKGSRINA